MARDNQKYDYYLVGIRKGSLTQQALLADVEKSSNKRIPTLIATRLGDYYEMKKYGIVSQEPQPPPQEDKPEDGYSATALSNAATALHEWD